METLFLVNPKKRRKSGKRRSAAQRAATRKMLAANRARKGGGSKRARRRASPVSMLVNPRRRRRHAHASKRSSRRMRRNPISLGSVRSITSKPMAFIAPALTGAIGAITVNTVLSQLSSRGIVPASLMTGRVRYVTQGVAAIVLGMVAQKLGVRATMAARGAEGALTVTLNDAIKDVAAGAGITLGGMGYYLPGRQLTPVAGNPMLAGTGKYVSGPGSANVMPMRSMAGAFKRTF